jgi:hypothetical protein
LTWCEPGFAGSRAGSPIFSVGRACANARTQPPESRVVTDCASGINPGLLEPQAKILPAEAGVTQALSGSTFNDGFQLTAYGECA